MVGTPLARALARPDGFAHPTTPSPARFRADRRRAPHRKLRHCGRGGMGASGAAAARGTVRRGVVEGMAACAEAGAAVGTGRGVGIGLRAVGTGGVAAVDSLGRKFGSDHRAASRAIWSWPALSSARPAFICSISWRKPARSRAMDCNSCAESPIGSAALEPALSAALWGEDGGRAAVSEVASAAGASAAWSAGGLCCGESHVATNGGAHFATICPTAWPRDCQSTAAPARQAVMTMPITPRNSRRPSEGRAFAGLAVLPEAARSVLSTAGTAMPATACAAFWRADGPLLLSSSDLETRRVGIMSGAATALSRRPVGVGLGAEVTVGALPFRSTFFRSRAGTAYQGLRRWRSQRKQFRSGFQQKRGNIMKTARRLLLPPCFPLGPIQCLRPAVTRLPPSARTPRRAWPAAPCAWRTRSPWRSPRCHRGSVRRYLG